MRGAGSPTAAGSVGAAHGSSARPVAAAAEGLWVERLQNLPHHGFRYVWNHLVERAPFTRGPPIGVER